MFSSKMFHANSGGGWLQRAFPGGFASTSSAGIRVTPEVAMSYDAVYACVTLLAESIAQLPCELYVRGKGNARDKATDHPVYQLIHNQPNSINTPFEYFEYGQGCLGMYGNHYAVKTLNRRGYPESLNHFHPDFVIPLKGKDGLLYYRLLEHNEVVPANKMLHVRGFSLNGYVGISPIQACKNTIGLGIATQSHAAKMFDRGSTISGVIERPDKREGLDQEAVDKLLESWKQRHAGTQNAHSVALLQEGMTFKPLNMKAEDAQLIQSRGFSVKDVCRIFKVPPHMIQDLEKSSFNNIEHQGLQFVMYTLMSWLKRWEQSLMRDLLLPEERTKYYIEFNVAGLLRGDTKTRYEAYAIGRQWGWLCVNDIRRLENLPPIDGGDIYLNPLNMVEAGTTPTTQQIQEIEDILSA